MRSIGLAGAVSIGIGGMVGGGIFAVLGEAVSLAHSATMLAFLFAGIVALLTAYSYAKLSVYFQSEGGTVSFIDNSFGHNLLSGSTNLMLWFSYLITISLYAVAFGSYGETFFSHPSEYLRHILISTAIILPALINLISASFVSKSETMIVGIKVVLLVVIIISGIPYIDTLRLDITPELTSGASLMGVAVSGMIIFVAYEGFELIANAAQEIKEPNKNLPRAFFISVMLVIVLYVLIAIISVGNVPESKLLEAKDYALAIAAKPALGHVGFTLVAIAALLATFSAINATIYGNARLSYIVAMDGELPKFFTKEKNEIPFMGVMAILGLSLFLANTIDLSEIAIIGSASFLLIFFIVNLSAYKVRDKIGANKYVLSASIVLTFLALCVLLFHTYLSNVRSLIIFMVFIAVSVLFEYFYGKFVRGHIFHRKY
ncbi:APC family permease [Sulfurimonas marina]|uniref:Amino acid permease n=1 Tax=Sulfurimonas marina TaxID=2590551 RepID=A0A7M1B0S9_9BACT|nr:APC family permease [Sulfurimonas marina]QOP42318.1 amino acid permease [Sulfurimonas marina]